MFRKKIAIITFIFLCLFYLYYVTGIVLFGHSCLSTNLIFFSLKNYPLCNHDDLNCCENQKYCQEKTFSFNQSDFFEYLKNEDNCCKNFILFIKLQDYFYSAKFFLVILPYIKNFYSSILFFDIDFLIQQHFDPANLPSSYLWGKRLCTFISNLKIPLFA